MFFWFWQMLTISEETEIKNSEFSQKINNKNSSARVFNE